MSGCAVVELRQYTLWPGQREVLIELFDRALVEPQEAVGMQVLGQFRDLGHPDRFVWLRGFPDMAKRRASLEAFYDGPIWEAHRDAANATMIDSDDVRLLRPLVPASGFETLGPRPGAFADPASSLMSVTTCSLRAPADPRRLERELLPALAESIRPPLAVLVDEPSENTFPRLPVRAGEHVVMWLQRTDSAASHSETARTADRLAADILPELQGSPEHLLLKPTPRSRLR